jgi:predicted ribosomally synthesized peptide with SipW-like signal peptide
MNKKIIASLLTILAAGVIVSAGTVAYFTAQGSSEGNTFAAGTLSIDLNNANDSTPLQYSLTNWAPGNQTLVSFDVLNTGSMSINLRGQAGGTWGNPALDEGNVVSVISVERWDGTQWQTLKTDDGGIAGDFYYSPDGSNSNLYAVNPGEKAQMRLTVKFSPLADDKYQGQTFTAAVEAQAKQTQASAF